MKKLIAVYLLIFLTGKLAVSQTEHHDSYVRQIHQFKNSGKTNIAIYKPGKYVSGEKSDFYEPLYQSFSQLNQTSVSFIDEQFLTSYEGMCKNLVDILVIAEPERLTGRYFVPVKTFLNQGGALIITSNNLFVPNAPKPEVLKEGEGDNYYRKTIAYLGIKPYTSDIVPVNAIFDTDFLSGFPVQQALELPAEGVYVNTGSEKLIPEPYFGSVSPERYPVLRNYVVAKGSDPLGKILNSSVVFTQNWENQSRMVVIASNSSKSLINPENKYFNRLIENAVRHCRNKIFISSVSTDYACYRQGEPVKISFSVHNYHSKLMQATALIELQNENGFTKKFEKKLELPEGKITEGFLDFSIPENPSDYYEISVKIKSGDVILSKANNGFIVWNDEVVKNAPVPGIKNNNFTLNGKYALLTGTNYYESELGDLMWIKPNVKKLNDDLRDMANAGMNYLRIHYHHAKWYTDYFNINYGFVPEYFKDTNPGYLPDEKLWRIFDAHIYLCQKYGLVYGGDLFTLVPEEMGDPRGWGSSPMDGLQDLVLFQDKIEKQKEFLKLLSERYKNVPAIAWDLWNEPEIHLEHKLQEWGTEMKKTMRAAGDNHLITTGIWDAKTTGNYVDFYSSHNNYDQSSKIMVQGSKPNMFQEVWMDCPSDSAGDLLQARQMRRSLFESFSLGFAGFAPWQWTSQAKMRNDFKANWLEVWDDKLGCCVRSDGTLKPAGRYYSQFAVLTNLVPFYDCQNNLAKTENGTVEFTPHDIQKRGSYLMKYMNGDALLAGVATGVLSSNNRNMVEADSDTEIWFYTPNPKGIEGCKKMYVKVNDAVQLNCSFKKPPKSMFLIDVPTQKSMVPVNFSLAKGITTIQLEKWQSNYWIEINW